MKAFEVSAALGEVPGTSRESLIAAPASTDLDAVYIGLVHRYYDPVVRYISAIVGVPEQAEDLAQDTFLKAYLALPKQGIPENPRAWLYRIATNSTLDHLRRNRRLRLVGLDRLAHALPGRDRITAIEDAEPVDRALACLKSDDRTILVLFAEAGFKAPEVAEILDITPAAARKRRQRAREAFTAAYREATGEM